MILPKGTPKDADRDLGQRRPAGLRAELGGPRQAPRVHELLGGRHGQGDRAGACKQGHPCFRHAINLQHAVGQGLARQALSITKAHIPGLHC
ncbi:hypothetical protein HaLaN_21982, partial [Haematococcus lacustris]